VQQSQEINMVTFKMKQRGCTCMSKMWFCIMVTIYVMLENIKCG